MTQWIHFTDDIASFDLKAVTDAAGAEGLFVYRFNDEFPVNEARCKWGYRGPVIISCPDELVEEYQSWGDEYDEFLIPSSAFSQCNWWRC